MKRYRSDIPADASEQVIQAARRKGKVLRPRIVEYRLGSRVVGQRFYAPEGSLIYEVPLRDGKEHGRVYDFGADGTLAWMEPYDEGKLHGTAKQYDGQGRLIGQNMFIHGTGYDVSRYVDQRGKVRLSDICVLRDGQRHGFEWKLNEGRQSLRYEQHWQEDRPHGIEREWNAAGRLRRGYPRYWIHGQQITKTQYLRAARRDQTLPAILEKDNLPRRRFPADLKRLLLEKS